MFSINKDDSDEEIKVEEKKEASYLSIDPPWFEDYSQVVTTIWELFDIHKKTSFNFIESL